MNLGIIQTMLKPEQMNSTRAFSLKVGQIFQGKAVKLFRDDVAQIQVGTFHFVAKLKAPLILHQNYWFQVQPNEEQTELKVFDKVAGDSVNTYKTGSVGEQQLLNKLNVKATNGTLQLIKLLQKENIPFSTEQLQQAADQLLHEKNVTKGLNAVRYLITNQLSITSGTYQSLKAVQDDTPIAHTISKLITDLQNFTNKTKNTNQLLELLKQLAGDKLINSIESSGHKLVLSNEHSIHSTLRQLLSSFGFQYENDLLASMGNIKSPFQSLQYETLKPLLLTALSELNHFSNRETIEQLIYRITGNQLLSLSDGDFGHLFFQLPLQLEDELSDLTIQLYGKKNKNNTIDPNYCHLLFHLDLDKLNETLIDVKIQNRILSITIYNENSILEKIVQAMKSTLAEGLEKVDYKLSSIKVASLSGKSSDNETKYPRTSSIRRNEGYTGVDIKI